MAAGIYVNDLSAAGLLEQIRISREKGAQGVTLFAYSTLFPGDIPNDKAKALLDGPFSNKSKLPPMPWKSTAVQSPWNSY